MGVAAATLGLWLLGCGGGGAAVPSDGGADGSPSGMCGAAVASGEACHALADMGTRITPSCAAGTLPSGAGGTIADGTYVLTAQTLYNTPVCPSFGLSQTIRIAGTCFQTTSGAALPATGTGTVTVAGSTITFERVCVHYSGDGGFSLAGPSVQTFDATPTTLTVYTDYTSPGEPGTDNVAVYTRL